MPQAEHKLRGNVMLIELWSIRAIARGAFLSLDYLGKPEAGKDGTGGRKRPPGAFDCLCGAPCCRGWCPI